MVQLNAKYPPHNVNLLVCTATSASSSQALALPYPNPQSRWLLLRAPSTLLLAVDEHFLHLGVVVRLRLGMQCSGLSPKAMVRVRVRVRLGMSCNARD